MRCELIHTSLPRGLDGGSGFVIAARTGGMPRTLSDALSDLSGLPEAWPGASDWDRTLRATRCIEWRGQPAWVASVIRPCGLDHTGRGNRIAHHRMLDPEELRESDPVSLLLDHERWIAAWRGEPRELEAEAPRAAGPGHGGPAGTWRSVFGDAGVAAEAIERAYRSGVGAWIVVPSSADRLALLHELAGLLPMSNRWKRGWSTRPLRPASSPSPVIAVVDEREPAVRDAPANAAWIITPRAGEPPSASKELVARARNGRTEAPASSRSAGEGSVQWRPPGRLAAPTRTHVSAEAEPQPCSDAATEVKATASSPAIRIEMEPVRGPSTLVKALVIGLVLAGLAALTWGILR